MNKSIAVLMSLLHASSALAGPTLCGTGKGHGSTADRRFVRYEDDSLSVGASVSVGLVPFITIDIPSTGIYAVTEVNPIRLELTGFEKSNPKYDGWYPQTLNLIQADDALTLLLDAREDQPASSISLHCKIL